MRYSMHRAVNKRFEHQPPALWLLIMNLNVRVLASRHRKYRKSLLDDEQSQYKHQFAPSVRHILGNLDRE